MSIWVKICGTTSLQDARIAVEAGADAVGFVFAPSPRQVTADQAVAITSQLPASAEKIGIFVEAEPDEIEQTVVFCGLTGVQVHSQGFLGLPSRLKARFGDRFRVLQAVHFGEDMARKVEMADEILDIDGILIDSRTAKAVGGTGVAYDWEAVRQSVFSRKNGQKPRIVAGGLTPANVAEAITTLRPWGVDVVSGVEAAPRRKDAAKVREFVANARTADLNLK